MHRHTIRNIEQADNDRTKRFKDHVSPTYNYDADAMQTLLSGTKIKQRIAEIFITKEYEVSREARIAAMGAVQKSYKELSEVPLHQLSPTHRKQLYELAQEVLKECNCLESLQLEAIRGIVGIQEHEGQLYISIKEDDGLGTVVLPLQLVAEKAKTLIQGDKKPLQAFVQYCLSEISGDRHSVYAEALLYGDMDRLNCREQVTQIITSL